MKSSETDNFVDENAISTAAKNVNDLLLNLKHDPDKSVQWLPQYQMIVNPFSFQAMILHSSKNIKTLNKSS